MDRVLQVIGGMNRAGAETMIMNVYRILDRQKIQFDFLVYSDHKQEYEEEIVSLGGRVIHINDYNLLNFTSKIETVIKTYGPYIAIHAHTLHNIAFAMMAGKRQKNVLRIAHSHSTRNVIASGILKKIYENLTRRVIKKEAQVWLACGEEAGEYLFGKDFIRKGIIINNGVDLTIYTGQNDKCHMLQKEFETENKLVIGSIARLTELKNHKFMIEVAKCLKEQNVKFKMLLVGQGELKEKLQQLIVENDVENEVILTGVRSDVPDLLKLFDVFFMPSLFEGNPVTLIEAQASGLPCVVSDRITDKIDLRIGLIHKLSLETDSIDSWAKKLISQKNKRLTDDSIILETFKKNEYDVKSTMLKLVRIYQCGRID